MIAKVAEFCDAMRTGKPARWLTLCGNSGVGKTHCARRIQRWAESHFQCENSYWPDFILWPELIDSLRGSKREYAYDKFNDMRRWPFLALDDVLAERDPNGFAVERLLNLLSSRDGRWTVLTTNLSLAQVAGIEPRLASRLVRGLNLIAEVTTKDFALRLRQGR